MANGTIIVGGTSGDRYRTVTADLSLGTEQEVALKKIGKSSIDTLLFTAGGLSAKSRVTEEGKDVAWMVNHVARKMLMAGLEPLLSQGARVGYISTWGSYKPPPPDDYEYGVAGWDGMGHVLKSYVPNDQLFALLSKERPDLHILGYNPGPTKGTALAQRPDTPFLLRALGPLLRLMSRPVSVVSEQFLRSLDAAPTGISWLNAGKTIARSQHIET